jgi:hypothetical protein
VHALSVFTAHIASSSHHADHEVPSFHTRIWSLVFSFLLSFSLWLLWCGLCWLSYWEEVYFWDLSVSWVFSCVLVFSQAVHCSPIHHRS